MKKLLLLLITSRVDEVLSMQRLRNIKIHMAKTTITQRKPGYKEIKIKACICEDK